MDIDLVFVSQDIENLDAAIRRLGNYFWHVYSKKTWGFRVMRDRYGVQLRYEADMRATAFEDEGYMYDHRIFRCYESAQSITNQVARKFPVPSVFKWAIAYIIVFAILAPLFYFYAKRNVKKLSAAPLAPVRPYGNFIEESAKKDPAASSIISTLTHSPGISSSSERGGYPTMPDPLKTQPGATSSEKKPQICEEKRVGGCFAMGDSKSCKYENKVVCHE